jgi:hypothetical protein
LANAGDGDTATSAIARYQDTNIGVASSPTATFGIESRVFVPSLTTALYPERTCVIVFDLFGTITNITGTFQVSVASGVFTVAGATPDHIMASTLNSGVVSKLTFQFPVSIGLPATGSLFVPVHARISRVGASNASACDLTLHLYEAFFSAGEPGQGIDILELF